MKTRFELLVEVLVDGFWQRPIRVNDHRNDGWVGYQLSSKRMGVALPGEWRVAHA